MPHVPGSDAARSRAIKRHLWAATQRFVATCPLGAETLLATEVAALEDVEGVSIRPGGAVFDAPFDAVYAALLRLRVAESLRVVLVDRAAAGSFPMLFDQLKRVRWSLWLPERCAVTARVVSRRSRLRDDPGLERALKGALRQQGIDPEAAEGQPMTLHLRLEHDRAAVALDLGGPLYRRAGDKWVSRTTIRESAAAALVLLERERRDGAVADLVLDPFCGSGTLLAESLEVSLGFPAGRRRRPPFEASPAWSAGRFRHAQRAADAAAGRAPPALHLGRDADAAAVLVARRNLEAAGLLDHAELEVKRVQELDLEALVREHGASRPLLLSNPPYGKAAAALGASPQELLRGVLERARGWRFALLFPDPDALAEHPVIAIEARVPLVTGGLRNTMLLGSVH